MLRVLLALILVGTIHGARAEASPGGMCVFAFPRDKGGSFSDKPLIKFDCRHMGLGELTVQEIYQRGYRVASHVESTTGFGVTIIIEKVK